MIFPVCVEATRASLLGTARAPVQRSSCGERRRREQIGSNAHAVARMLLLLSTEESRCNLACTFTRVSSLIRMRVGD
jgi:hypothetical protein